MSQVVKYLKVLGLGMLVATTSNLFGGDRAVFDALHEYKVSDSFDRNSLIKALLKNKKLVQGATLLSIESIQGELAHGTDDSIDAAIKKAYTQLEPKFVARDDRMPRSSQQKPKAANASSTAAPSESVFDLLFGNQAQRQARAEAEKKADDQRLMQQKRMALAEKIERESKKLLADFLKTQESDRTAYANEIKNQKIREFLVEWGIPVSARSRELQELVQSCIQSSSAVV